MKVLVTGGGGFLGRHVVAQLANAGHEITITATGSEPSLPVAKTLYMGLEGIDWAYVRGLDAVIHLMANNDTRCQDWNEIWRANVYGSVRLFREAYQFGCRRFVYASSAAVYGNAAAPFTEKTPVNPLTYYAKSKEALDHLAWSFATEDRTDVSMSSLRFCNIYGPGEDHKGSRMSMVGQLIRKMAKAEKVKLFRDGEQLRDWLYVTDAAKSVIAALNADYPGFEIFNIGSGRARTFNDMVNIMVQKIPIAQWQPTVEYIDCPFPDQYQSHTECAIKKAGEKLGFRPAYDLESGIEEYITSYFGESALQPTA